MAVDVLEAAHRLGLSQRRVRRLIASGDLPAARIAGRYAIDDESLDALAERVRPAAVRGFSRRIAWAAAALVDGVEPDWVSPSELSRLRRRLSEAGVDPGAWQARLKARAAATLTYRVAPGNVRRLLSGGSVTTRSGASTHNLVTERQLAASVTQVWLAQRRDLPALEIEYRMLASPAGNVLVRIAEVEGQASTGAGGDTYRLIVAADLLDSGDARERRAGRELLRAALVERRWAHTTGGRPAGPA